MPKRILELPTIRRVVEAGDVVITCGGGGIPVIHDAEKGLRGVAAVIDKDYASALLAREIGARQLLILTAVDRVAINFGKSDERALSAMTVADARRWLGEGQFPAGSMGPKVQAAVEFLEHSKDPQAEAIIGPLDGAVDAIAGRAGTRITRS